MRIGLLFRFVSFAVLIMALSAAMFGQVGVAISIGPPPLPIYEQPACPGDGYLWTPGYWAYDDGFDDYYWVPGAWVLPPDVGFLWTPPYWAWNGTGFMFYDGYWGPTIGFYGGVNYGFGYFGTGFVGGRWENGHFFYNRAVVNVNVTNIHNVYNTTVNNVTENRVSYNGGDGGINARPTAQEEAAARDRHIGAVQAQVQQAQTARGDQKLRASVNRGKPPIAATARAGALNDHAVSAEKAGGSYNPRPTQPAAERTNGSAERTGNAERANENGGRQAIHPNDLSPIQRPPAPNSGNAKADQKYQQEQDKMVASQEKERQKLQMQQDKEHQKAEKQQVNAQKNQQMEQRHQQETAKMQQRQTQQMQHMQERQAPAMHSQARPPRQ